MRAPIHPSSGSSRRQRGGTLLVVIWCLLVMTMVIVMVGGGAQDEMLAISGRIGQERARQIAHMGLALAQHPQVKPGDPILFQDLGNGEALEVNVSSEEARLNLNLWLAEDRRETVVRLFRLWGLDRRDAEGVVDCLSDWVDPDGLKHAQGAEAGDYPQRNRPFNRPFSTLDELRLVRGFELVERLQPEWRTRLTVKGQGSVDLMAAPADLIEAATGATGPSIQRWIGDRWGRDGRRHTDDDPQGVSVDQVLAQLGVASGQTSFFTVEGPTRRIQALGVKGDYASLVSLIVSGNAGGAQAIFGLEEQNGTLDTILEKRNQTD